MNNNPVHELQKIADYVPNQIFEGANQRMTDHLNKGGQLCDDYMWKQFRYAQSHFKNRIER